MKNKKVTGETMLGEIMNINPDSGKILFEHGLHCIGCGMASMETLEQGCLAHGMSKKEIGELIEKLNGKKEEVKEKIEKPIVEEKIEKPESQKRRKPSLIQKIRRSLR